MAESAYDCIVIGAGPGGYVAAIRAAQLGMRTAVVERDKVGGRCLNYACIPAKSVLRSADLLSEMREAAEYGIACRGVEVDYPAMQARRARVVSTLTGGVRTLFKKNERRADRGRGDADAGRPPPRWRRVPAAAGAGGSGGRQPGGDRSAANGARRHACASEIASSPRARWCSRPAPCRARSPASSWADACSAPRRRGRCQELPARLAVVGCWRLGHRDRVGLRAPRQRGDPAGGAGARAAGGGRGHLAAGQSAASSSRASTCTRARRSRRSRADDAGRRLLLRRRAGARWTTS